MYQISSAHHDKLCSVSQKRNRNRNVILSEQGWRKLAQADVLDDQWGNHYTYESLSERSLLNERTVSRVLSREVRVDRRTLKIFFAAFGLQISGDDYTTAECHPVCQPIMGFSHYLDLPVYTAEANLPYQELVELYQRLIQDLNYLSHLLNLDKLSENIPLQGTELQ